MKGLTDYLVTILELLLFQNRTLLLKKNYYAEFEIDKTILTVPDGWTDPNYRKGSILKIQ